MKRIGIPLLILTLALGSVYQAVMHMAHASGTMVELCIDGQAATISIGPDGEPGPNAGHDCTECVLIAGFAAPAPLATTPHLPIARALVMRPSTRPSQRGPVLAAATARAPPVSV